MLRTYSTANVQLVIAICEQNDEKKEVPSNNNRKALLEPYLTLTNSVDSQTVQPSLQI